MRSVNQNHHLYVAKSVNTVNSSSGLGTIQACAGGDVDKHIYFKYVGHDGIVRSDLIPVDQISYIKHIPASAQVTRLKKVTVNLDSTVNSGNPVVGKDYILNIAFQQFYGLSPEDTYVKTIAVHVTNATSTPQTFYAAMEQELNRAFSREVGATPTSNPYLEFDSDANGVYITEKEQPWSLGKWEVERLVFDVFPSTIFVQGEEYVWGETSDGLSDTVIQNNKRMADLEWFTFGERGDIYRGMGYPNNFDFIPMVTTDTSVVNGYGAIEIHYAYQGSCEDIQKSEKDITIIGADAVINSLKTTLQGQNYYGKTIPSAVAQTTTDSDENP